MEKNRDTIFCKQRCAEWFKNMMKEKGKKKCCKRSEKESKLITKNQNSEGSSGK